MLSFNGNEIVTAFDTGLRKKDKIMEYLKNRTIDGKIEVVKWQNGILKSALEKIVGSL